MPYIPKKDRSKLFPETKGELNYLVTTIALDFLKKKGLTYQNISDSIAALNDAASELRRRVLDFYEDEMIHTNGDLEEYKEVIKLIQDKFNEEPKYHQKSIDELMGPIDKDE